MVCANAQQVVIIQELGQRGPVVSYLRGTAANYEASNVVHLAALCYDLHNLLVRIWVLHKFEWPF